MQTNELLQRKNELNISYEAITRNILKMRGVEPTPTAVNNHKSSIRKAILNPETVTYGKLQEIVQAMEGDIYITWHKKTPD
jgi:hypothetical protein